MLLSQRMNISDIKDRQLRACYILQTELIAAMESKEFNAVAAIASVLKDLTQSYANLGEPAKSQEMFRQVATKPPITSYAYPDGFAGVSLDRGE